MLVLTAGLLGIFTFGFFVADILLGRKAHILERIAVGFLLGSGIFTFVLFLANWKLNIPFGLKESLLILLSLNIIAFLLDIFFDRKGKVKKIFDYNFNFKEGFENSSSFEKIIIGLILFLFFSSLIHNLYWPVSDWDSLAVYDFRAKSFLLTGYMKDAINSGYFTAYPLYTSLSHTFLYLLGFKNPVFFYSFLYISLIVSLFFVMHRITHNRTFSLLFALLLSFNPFIYGHSLMSYTNLPYTVMIAVGFAYILFSFLNERLDFAAFTLGAVLVSLSSWVRSPEPFWLLAFPFIILFSLYSKKVFHFIFLSLVVYFPRFIWFEFLKEYKVVAGSYDSGALVGIKGMILNLLSLNHNKILSYFFENMVFPYSILLIVFSLSLLFLLYYLTIKKSNLDFKNIKNIKFVSRLLPSGLVLSMLALMLLGLYLFIFSFGDLAFEIVGSAERSTMPLVPITLFSIFINIHFIFNNNHYAKKI